MGANIHDPGTTVVPALRYRNVPAAIDWLCKAFGFEKHRVVAGENGTVRYVQLTFGSGMVMVGPVLESALNKLMLQPDEIGGAETQTCYFFVGDAKAHYARAKAAGAEIVLELEEGANGGLGYSCRDPEGHIWNFGTYNPWRQSASSRRPPSGRRAGRSTLLAGLALATVCSFAAVVWMPSSLQESLSDFATMILEGGSSQQGTSAREPLSREASAAERAAQEARDQAAQERSAREAAERASRETRELLAQMWRAVEQSERSAQEAREQLAQEIRSKEAMEPTARDAREQLAQALLAKEAAERAAKDAQEELAQARAAKEAAERVAKEARERATRERNARAAAERAAAAAKSSSPLSF